MSVFKTTEVVIFGVIFGWDSVQVINVLFSKNVFLFLLWIWHKIKMELTEVDIYGGLVSRKSITWLFVRFYDSGSLIYNVNVGLYLLSVSF